MSLLPALAVLLLASAAFVGQAAHPARSGSRILAGLGTLALLPSAGEAETWPWVALAGGAAGLGAPLPCLLAAGGAALVLLRGSLPVSFPAALGVAGLAADLAAAALGAAARARLAAGADPAWAATAGGASLSLVLVILDRGRVLGWAFGLGSAGTRLEIPGAGLLLGLTLLAAWAGTLCLAAHSFAPSVGGARLAGQRLLVLAGGLSVLGVGVVLYRGFREGPQALALSATGVTGQLLATGLLALGLGSLLSPPPREDPSSLEAEATLTGRLAALLALLAAGLAGAEAWLGRGRYATSLVSAAGAAAILGLAALERTRLGLSRRAAFVVGLVFLLV